MIEARRTDVVEHDGLCVPTCQLFDLQYLLQVFSILYVSLLPVTRFVALAALYTFAALL